MKALLIATSLMFGLTTAATGHAQVPAGAPAGTTGLCKDGSYSSSDTKKGACRGHKGVKDWYTTASATPAAEAGAAKSAKTGIPTAPAPIAATAGAKPADATGLCRDGTYFTGAEKKGACRGHKGVKDWYGAAAAPAKPAPPPAPAPKMAPAAPMAPMAPAPNASTMPAAGGGNGKVWVNTETKVYHCPDDRYYGKTKQGEYMSESEAIAKGSHASHGKSCAK